jgi:hypothetical protein
MPKSTVPTFTNPTTPWGAACLLNPDGPTALSASLGFSAYTKSLVATTNLLALKAAAHLDGVVNVRDYGAVADGVTDDLAACQAALTALGAAGVSHAAANGLTGATVPTLYFPKGKYRLSGPITAGARMQSVHVAGDNSILICDAGQYAFDVGIYCSFSRLQFHDGAWALKIDTNNNGGLIYFDNCYLWGQSTACVDINNNSASTLLTINHSYLWPKTNGQVVVSGACDAIVFNDSWIYCNHATKAAIETTDATVIFNHLFGVPAANLLAWLDISGGSLRAVNCRFGGESGGAVSVARVLGIANVDIRDCGIYTAGPILKLYALPPQLILRGNQGMSNSATTRIWIDPAIAAGAEAALATADCPWDIADNVAWIWPTIKRASGTDALRKTIALANPSRRRLRHGALNAADYLINYLPDMTQYGANSYGGCPINYVANDEDAASNTLQCLATADDQGIGVRWNTILTGLAAQTATAVVCLDCRTDSQIDLTITVAAMVWHTHITRGRHTLSVPFWIDGTHLGLTIESAELASGDEVRISRIQIVAGEREMRDARADLVGAAAPVTGTWCKGDRVRILSAAAGTPQYRVCTAKGTPGVWATSGLLLPAATSIGDRTIVRTIALSHLVATDDYQFDDTQANTTQQIITLASILPAWSTFVCWQVRCLEGVDAGKTANAVLGTTAGGGEIMASAPFGPINTVSGSIAAPRLTDTAAAKNVYFGLTPSANWNAMAGLGRWVVVLTYVDNGAAYLQRTV